MPYQTWAPRQPNAHCDRCNFEYKLSQLRREWDGLMVCYECWEPRQPQDFVRGVPDQKPIPMARPGAPDIFLTAPTDIPSNVTTITVTASPFTYTNNTTLTQNVSIMNGTVSNVAVTGTSVSKQTGINVVLSPKQSVIVTYSSAPNMYFV